MTEHNQILPVVLPGKWTKEGISEVVALLSEKKGQEAAEALVKLKLMEEIIKQGISQVKTEATMYIKTADKDAKDFNGVKMSYSERKSYQYPEDPERDALMQNIQELEILLGEMSLPIINRTQNLREMKKQREIELEKSGEAKEAVTESVRTTIPKK